MEILDLEDAVKRLPQLVKRVENGGQWVTIKRNGEPAALLAPIEVLYYLSEQAEQGKLGHDMERLMERMVAYIEAESKAAEDMLIEKQPSPDQDNER